MSTRVIGRLPTSIVECFESFIPSFFFVQFDYRLGSLFFSRLVELSETYGMVMVRLCDGTLIILIQITI